MRNQLFGRFINLIASVAVGGAMLLSVNSGTAVAAPSKLVAKISIAAQRMEVTVDGRAVVTWKVSTAGKGYVTPKGSFKPTRMHEMWYSRKYDNAPMPHSVFFRGGYAVHATPHVRNLGRPASHGCVRLAPESAADFFQLVQTFGPSNTDIVIVE